MKYLKSIGHSSITFLVILITLQLSCNQSVAQEIKLLVIIDDTNPLEVSYYSKADMVGSKMNSSFGGLLPGLIMNSVIEKRNSKYSTKLQELVGDFESREHYIKEMLLKGFSDKTDKIKLSFININDANEYLSKKKPNYESLKKDDWAFVLFLTENAGLSTPANNLGKLAISSTFTIKVFDIINKKNIFNQPYTSLSPQVFEKDSALTDKNIFTSNYPKIHNLGHMIYMRLSGTDVLNKMAKHYEMEAEFPPISVVLNNYAEKFTYDLFIPKGWKRLPSTSAFHFSGAPKKDLAVVGINTNIDLLIEPLGQKDLDILEYTNLGISRLKDLSFEVRQMEEDLQILDLNEEWVFYLIILPNGGVYIMLNRIVNKEYVVNNQIVLLGDNYKDLLIKHKEEVEDYINQSKLVLK